MKNNIYIKYDKKNFIKIVKKKIIIKFIQNVFNELNLVNASCSIFFTTNETIQKLNKEYLNKDHPTDVLSFSQIEGDKADFIELNFLGDIVISLPYAINEAKKNNNQLNYEIYFLIIHGILHLLGYNHEIDKSNKMLDLQNKIYSKLLGDLK